MMSVRWIIRSVLLLTCISNLYKLYVLLQADPIPEVEEVWWGGNGTKLNDTKIYEFKITVDEEDIKDVYKRLNNTRTPAFKQINASNHEHGLNWCTMNKIFNYIKNEFNFNEQLNVLNSYSQYITNIQGINVHFVRLRPKHVPKNGVKVNVLLLHGWPSSVREFYSLLPLFEKQNGVNNMYYEVVIPGIPGFGYSEVPEEPGGGHVKHIAVLLNNLMKRLNLHNYYVHGGDWGGVVASAIATLFPDNISGFHSNFCLSIRYLSILKLIASDLYPSILVPKPELQSRLYPLWDKFRFYVYESGYLHALATKSDTHGYSVDNSIEGLLAFLLEKHSVATNANNIYKEKAGLDEYNLNSLIDTVLFYYWFPKSSTTAARIYSDNLSLKGLTDPIYHAIVSHAVPCGCVYFKHEFVFFPEHILRDKFPNLIHYTTYDIGGHFVALEETNYKLLFNDLLKFIIKTKTLEP